tara:strand:+ start:27 stop:458 length:432 start_codon:yes stop_codon:yes gene_type:complete
MISIRKLTLMILSVIHVNERRIVMKFKFKPEDVDFVYVDTSEDLLKFRIVKKKDDGDDIAIGVDAIEFSPGVIDALCADVLEHLREGKEVDVLDDDEDVIIFEPDPALLQADDRAKKKALEEIEDELLDHANRFCINGRCSDE